MRGKKVRAWREYRIVLMVRASSREWATKFFDGTLVALRDGAGKARAWVSGGAISNIRPTTPRRRRDK